jgi:hypothetical protein
VSAGRQLVDIRRGAQEDRTVRSDVDPGDDQSQSDAVVGGSPDRAGELDVGIGIALGVAGDDVGDRAPLGRGRVLAEPVVEDLRGIDRDPQVPVIAARLGSGVGVREGHLEIELFPAVEAVIEVVVIEAEESHGDRGIGERPGRAAKEKRSGDEEGFEARFEAQS